MSDKQEVLRPGPTRWENFLDSIARTRSDQKEEEELVKKMSAILRPRIEILCQRFIQTTRARRDQTDLLRLNPGSEGEYKKPIESLDDYIASLNIDREDLDTNNSYGDKTLDFALGTHWKSEVNS